MKDGVKFGGGLLMCESVLEYLGPPGPRGVHQENVKILLFIPLKTFRSLGKGLANQDFVQKAGPGTRAWVGPGPRAPGPGLAPRAPGPGPWPRVLAPDPGPGSPAPVPGPGTRVPVPRARARGPRPRAPAIFAVAPAAFVGCPAAFWGRGSAMRPHFDCIHLHTVDVRHGCF